MAGLSRTKARIKLGGMQPFPPDPKGPEKG
jgi:hypothetical protein